MTEANDPSLVDFKRSIDPNKIISQLPKPNTLRMKIISMGTENTGKSCIIKRYCEERFIPKYITTIGIDYGVKRINIDGQEIRVNFWDLAGGSEWLEIRSEFYKDAQGAILVYDVTNPKSFIQMESYVAEAQKFGAKDLMVAVCANKIDSTGKKAVSDAEGRKWAQARGYSWWETSASSGQNIPEMFDQLFKDTYQFRKL